MLCVCTSMYMTVTEGAGLPPAGPGGANVVPLFAQRWNIGPCAHPPHTWP